MKKLSLCGLLLLLCFTVLPGRAKADAVTDTIGIYVGYYGWSEDQYLEKVTYHWTELDDWVGGALDTQENIYSYYSGSRTYLVAARGFTIRDLLAYSGIDFSSIASIDFFTKDHTNGAYRSFSCYSLLSMPRYYFPNLAANEETGEIYPWEGDDIWAGATTVEAILALEDYTEWDTVGSDFAQRYDSSLLSPGCRFHLFFGQSDPSESSTSSAAKYCYKILITFVGTPVLSTEETDMTLKIGSGKKIELTVDAEDGLLNDYVRQHIFWASSDESILSVGEDGTLTAHAAGEAVITASFGESAVSVRVSVEDGEEGGEGGGSGNGSGDASKVGFSGEGDGAESTRNTEKASGEAKAETPQASPAAVPMETAVPMENLPTVEIPSAVLEASPEETLEAAAIPVPRLKAISAAVMSGMAQSSPDGESLSGSKSEDSAQLVVSLTENDNWKTPVLGSAIASFALGFGFGIWRFKRLLRRG